MNLGEQLAAARAEVARLEKMAKTASCAELGHPRRFVGCAACCCDLGDGLSGECSVPVHECACGDSDYGENDEARQIKADCAKRRAEEGP